MKVLLVDDEQKFAQMLAKRLELRGIGVDVCFSGDQALETAQKSGRFDVAILDVKMPCVSGVELKRRLAKLDPDLKFIFLTGHGANSECLAELSEKADYLPKPLKIDELIDRLNQLTEG